MKKNNVFNKKTNKTLFLILFIGIMVFQVCINEKNLALDEDFQESDKNNLNNVHKKDIPRSSGQWLDPIEVGQLEDGGRAKDIYILDNLAYLADYEEGLKIINITFKQCIRFGGLCICCRLF